MATRNPFGFWTEEKRAILRESYEKDSRESLVERLGTGWASIKIQAGKLGLKRVNRGVKGFWDEIRDQSLVDWFDLRDMEDIAEDLGVSTRAVTARAARIGLRQICSRSEIGQRLSSLSDSVDVDFFNRGWSESVSYILGFTWADGNIGSARPPSMLPRTLSYTLHPQDEDILIQIRERLRSNHKLHYRDAWTTEEGRSYGPRVRCSISNVHLVRPLYENYGIVPRKSYVDPPYPDNIPDEYLGHFSRGVMDGDGSFGIRNERSSSGSARFTGGYRFSFGLQESISRVIGIPRNQMEVDGLLCRFGWWDWEHLKTLYHFLYPSDKSICGMRKKGIIESLLNSRLS